MESGVEAAAVPLRLRTERLDLVALGPAAVSAWAAGDAPALARETGCRIPEPPPVPPLLGEDLPRLSEMLGERGDERGWWLWLIALRDGGCPAGVVGLGGPPGEDGTVQVGYSILPQLEGRGYATEALTALLDWSLARPDVRKVVATIPPSNAASIRVAEKAGMKPAGKAVDPEAGEVLVYQTTR